MQVNVISDTKQEFNGETFYLCGSYFQHNGKRLHRTVWEYHNGKIEKGFHIHHKDHDRNNNQIDNLEKISSYEHLSNHMSEEERVKQSKESIKKAREAADVWHGSEAGFEFHSKLAKENWKKRKVNTYNCTFCGKEFQTKYIYGEGQNHFCHPNCRASYGRRKRRNESVKS